MTIDDLRKDPRTIEVNAAHQRRRTAEAMVPALAGKEEVLCSFSGGMIDGENIPVAAHWQAIELHGQHSVQTYARQSADEFLMVREIMAELPAEPVRLQGRKL